MAKILILGGGFGAVVAAKRLADELDDDHQITLVSRSRSFVFYPALVRLAFDKCKRENVSFDLRESMLSQRVNFIEAEVARIDPCQRKVTIAHGDVEGKLPYDYLVFALGRRLATERITGFYENAHHLLSVDQALQFKKSIAAFHGGRAVIGQCPGSRLPVPVYETAFALSRLLSERGERGRVRITIISPEPSGAHLDDADLTTSLTKALEAHDIEVLPCFPVAEVTRISVITSSGFSINFDLMMLMPPFEGSPVGRNLGATNAESYVNVDSSMRVIGVEGAYAVGDCVSFSGPKMGHMAVRQAQVAAINLAAEINGHEPVSHYLHEMKLVIDASGSDNIYVHKDLWLNEPATVRQGRFWSWAKRAQEKCWEASYF